jgi:hypothetical protein
VADEFVSEDGSARFDLDLVDSYGRDFREDNAAEGVDESEVDAFKDEVDIDAVCLVGSLVLGLQRGAVGG